MAKSAVLLNKVITIADHTQEDAFGTISVVKVSVNGAHVLNLTGASANRLDVNKVAKWVTEVGHMLKGVPTRSAHSSLKTGV